MFVSLKPRERSRVAFLRLFPFSQQILVGQKAQKEDPGFGVGDVAGRV